MNSDHTVLIGAGGMLGTEWARALPTDIIALDYPAFDLTAPNAGEAIPDTARLVINCSAYTDVDGAEHHEDDALALNGTAVASLAERCRAIGAVLVHYSTDYVFDGQGDTPYPTDHPRAPRSAYGRTKLAGEQALETSGADFLCVRTSWLYAPHANNFVRTIARLCAEKPELKVVSDQRGRPTSAEQLVRTTQALLDANARGFFHACDSGDCTWFDFATAIAERVNPACRIAPCTTDEFPRDAERPAYSVLDLAATETIAGPIPHWRDALARTLDTILASAPEAPRKAC